MQYNQLKLFFLILLSLFFHTSFQAQNPPSSSQPIASNQSSKIAAFFKKHDLLAFIGSISGVTLFYRFLRAYEEKAALETAQLQAQLDREEREHQRRQQEHEQAKANEQQQAKQKILNEEWTRQQSEYNQQSRLARERQQAEWELRQRELREKEERDRQEKERLRKQQEEQEQRERERVLQDIQKRKKFWAKLGKRLLHKEDYSKKKAPHIFLSEETKKVYSELNIPLYTSPFEPLGVADNAPKRELIKAHRKLVAQIHPDRNSTPEAHVQFRLLQACYENCLDIKNRQSGLS